MYWFYLSCCDVFHLRLVECIISSMNKIRVVVFAIILLLCCVGCGEAPYIYEDGAILCGGDGEPIELINNSNATNPTYAELLASIREDSTDKQPYSSTFTCADFAEAVHNDAEEAGMRAAFVSVYFEGEDEGHALNAFDTIDRGLVYIDCTGEGLSTTVTRPLVVEIGEEDVVANRSLSGWDKVAYIEIGKEYGVVDIAKADSLSYSFYQGYKHKWESYHRQLEFYNLQVGQFNKEVEQFNKEVEQFNKEVEGKTYEMFTEEWMKINFWEAMLDAQAEELDAQAEQLHSLGEELGDYWFEPLGVVEDINIHW